MCSQISAKSQMLLMVVTILQTGISRSQTWEGNNFVAVFCGCHELQSIQQLGTRNSTPSTLTDVGETSAATTLLATYQLKEFANNLSRCSEYCAEENINSTHLTVIGLECQCHSNLNTFHCEEEEGEPLANVYCLEVKKAEQKVDITEPTFSWREPLDMLPTDFDPLEMESLKELDFITRAFNEGANSTVGSDGDIESASTDAAETSVILVTVLLVAAVLLLAVMAGKTCWEIRKQKSNEMKKRLQESKESFTTVTMS